MNPTQEMAIEVIAKHYGMKNRLCMLMEECGELIQAANKALRYMDGDFSTVDYSVWEHIKEEIADVEICMEEVLYFLGPDSKNSVSDTVDYKITRLLTRLVDKKGEDDDRAE